MQSHNKISKQYLEKKNLFFFYLKGTQLAQIVIIFFQCDTLNALVMIITLLVSWIIILIIYMIHDTAKDELKGITSHSEEKVE